MDGRFDRPETGGQKNDVTHQTKRPLSATLSNNISERPTIHRGFSGSRTFFICSRTHIAIDLISNFGGEILKPTGLAYPTELLRSLGVGFE